MIVLVYFAIVLDIALLDASRIHHDPALIHRIPAEIKTSIDEAVDRRFRRTISAHFLEESTIPNLFESERFESDATIDQRSPRIRRDVTNSTDNNSTTSAVFSEWGDFGVCSAKCGGGQQVRYRTCLQGTCKDLGPYTEARKCGMFPCVAGSYVLDSISAFGHIAIPDAKMVRFFTISGSRYFGYITNTELHILKWNNKKTEFLAHQIIPVTSGVSFDVLNTYPRTYMVVIEKALMIFPGRFSKMYYYDPWSARFQTTTAVTIDVWEPSALRTFDVFGTAFLGIVNYQTKMVSNYGVTYTRLVCNGQTKTASCPAGSIITVVNAMYGRVTNYDCANGVDVFMSWFQYFATCVVPGTKEKVSAICDSNESCELTANPANFVEPNGVSCPQTNNYLRVTYTCSSISYMGMPIFYKWDGVGLSLISGNKLITNGAIDIEAFAIHDQQYIAVANHVNDQKEHHLDSEVYIYNLDSGRFQSLQKIRTEGAVDWEFFSIGEGLAREYFLVVANHVKILPNGVRTYKADSVIYKWNWNLFVPFQCIETYGAKKWTALAGATGRFTLTVTNIYGNTTFYNYDGWRFNLATVQPKDDIFKNAVALYVYKQGTEPMFLVQNNNKKFNETRNFYKTTFMKTFPKYELLESTLRSVQELNRSVYEDVFPKATTFNRSYTIIREDIVFLDNVNFAGHKIFQNVHVKGNTTVNFADISRIYLSPSDLRRQQKLKELNRTISNFDELVGKANATLQDVVTKSSEQIISSRKTFYKNLNISQLFVKYDVHVGGVVNGVKISEVKERALYLNENATITGNFVFKNVSVRSFNVPGTFGNIRPSDVVTIDGNETVSGRKTFLDTKFSGKRKQNMHVKNLFNGINTKDLLTVSDDQNISSTYVFNDTVFVMGDVAVRDTVNGQHLSDVADDTIMIDLPTVVINGRKKFKDINIAGDLNIRTNVTVNGVDISELLKIGLHLSSTEFNSDVIFASDVRFLSHVTVGNVNGLNLTEVVFTDVDSVINAPIVIKNDIRSSANVHVGGKVNGLNLSDVLDTVSNQTISAKKTFTSDVTFIKDVQTGGLVDGVNISDLYARSMTMNSTQNVTGYKIFKTLTLNSLRLEKCNHDCKLLHVLKNIKHGCARESSEVVSVSGHKSFKNLSIDGNVKVLASVNDVRMPGDLLLQGTNQTVSGPNYFLRDVTMEGNVTAKNINNVNMLTMYQKALLKSNLTFQSRVSFKDDFLINDNLYVRGLINNVQLKDVVLSYGDQWVVGNKTFKNKIHVHELLTRKMITYGLIDGVNLTALNMELLSLTGSRIVKGTKVFKKGVSFAGNWTIPGLIDGVNVTELYHSAMTLMTEQRISGHKTFQERTRTTTNITVKGLADNVNLTHLVSHAILTTKTNITQHINAYVKFQNISIVNSIDVAGTITRQNLNKIVNNTLMKSGNQYITGVHKIVNMTVTKEVNVETTVNGVDLSEEVVLLHDTSTITGRKNFDNITVLNIITELVDGLNLTNFSYRIAYIDEPTTFLGLVTFTNDIGVKKNITVNKFINGLNLTHIVTTTIMQGGEQTIVQPIHIRKAVFIDNVLNTNLFNLVNFTKFSKNIIYKCVGPNRNITGQISFNKMTVKGVLKVINLIVKDRINKIDLVVVNEEAVRDSGVFIISGLKRLYGELVVANITSGPINGFTFPSDFVGISGTDVITGKKIFAEDVLVKGDINMRTRNTVNGIDISYITSKMVQLGKNDTVSSNVRFLKDVTVKGNMKSKLVNGVYISVDKLLLTYGNQTVTASKMLSSVIVEGVVVSGNHINDFDLKKIQDESYISGLQNIMRGNMTIIGDVYIKGNLQAGNLNNIENITARFYGFNRITTYLNVYIPTIYQSIGITRTVIAQLASSIENVHQSLDYFMDEQDIHLPYVSKSIDVFTKDDEVWLAAGSLSDAEGRMCSNMTVFIRSYKNMSKSTFVSKYAVLSNAVTGLKFIKDSENLYLISSSNRRNFGCFPELPSAEQSVTYRYNNGSNAFERYTSTRTEHASAVDASVFQNRISAFFTNTYYGNCPDQTLHSLINSSFELKGSFESCGAIKSIILSQDDVKTSIAILGSNTYGYRQLQIIDLLENGIRTVKQVMATHFASDVIHLVDDGKDFIVIANTYDSSEEALAISYTVPVAVYRLETSGLYEAYQNIEVRAALKVQPLRIGIYNYLVVATYQQEIIILKHKSASKWNVEMTVPIQGYGSIKDLKTWTINDEVYMAVLSSNIWNMTHPSKIRVMKGFLTSSVEGSDIISKVTA